MSVTLDKAGYEYLTGSFQDTIVFGKDTLKNPVTESSIFFVKYDSIGNEIWARQFENIDSNNWLGYSVATDTFEHIYLFGGGGVKTCRLKYGNDTLKTFVPGNGFYDAASFIAQFDSSGNMLCGSMISGGGDDLYESSGSIAVSPGGNYYLCAGMIFLIFLLPLETIGLLLMEVRRIHLFQMAALAQVMEKA